MNLLTSALTQALDLFFPKLCLFCGTKGTYLCTSCQKQKLQVLSRQYCHVCLRETGDSSVLVHQKCQKSSYLAGVFSVLFYNVNAGEILHQLKYGLYFNIAKDLGKMMRRRFSETILNSGIQVDNVVPVPLHRRRSWWRGFNQAELLAKEITPDYQNMLQRVKYRHPQVGLSKEQRKTSVKDIFAVKHGGNLQSKTILLIDDVMTTGATLEECAKALRAAGAAKVYALVWARDPLD